jgi:alpha-beta hydrolase superfamily lysophospholipase
VSRSSPSVTGSRSVTVDSDDGVRMAGLVVPAAPEAGPRPPTFVVVHGFTGSITRPSFRRLAGWLCRFGEVRGHDARGHGRSGGRSTVGGDPEVRDVNAAVAAARADGARAVVTLGMSLGGGVVLRQQKDPAAPHRGRSPSSSSLASSGRASRRGRRRDLHRGRWYIRDTPPMRRVHWLLEAPLGRRVVAPLLRLRLDDPWVVPPESPLAVVGRITPTPLLLVHGDRDTYFPLEHLRALVRAAGPTTTAWVVPGSGHAESGATAPLVERIGRWVSARIGS